MSTSPEQKAKKERVIPPQILVLLIILAMIISGCTGMNETLISEATRAVAISTIDSAIATIQAPTPTPEITSNNSLLLENGQLSEHGSFTFTNYAGGPLDVSLLYQSLEAYYAEHPTEHRIPVVLLFDFEQNTTQTDYDPNSHTYTITLGQDFIEHIRTTQECSDKVFGTLIHFSFSMRFFDETQGSFSNTTVSVGFPCSALLETSGI